MAGPVSLRMAVNLNALVHRRQSAEVATRAVLGPDVAHHVVDSDDLLGLGPDQAIELGPALARLAARSRSAWLLSLPAPGALGSLRGPGGLNHAALEAGEVVVALSGDLALVPHHVGPAVQWRVFAAERPFPPPSPYEAERRLAEAVLEAADVLAQLEVAGGRRPDPPAPVALAPGYSPRQRLAADRASGLITACDQALGHDGAARSAFEADLRFRQVRAVRRAAVDALCAAVSWLDAPPDQ